ncbi:MAG TPA: DUF1707 domain-containing protein [Acidimicrobiales bacterium]
MTEEASSAVPPEKSGLSGRARTRVGDAGRERAIGVLQRAFAKGQLTHEELDRRVEVVYRAQIRNDLRPVLEDLPEYQALRVDRRMKAFWLD